MGKLRTQNDVKALQILASRYNVPTATNRHQPAL